MSYARWANKKEVLDRLEAINVKKGCTKSGIPMSYDDKFLYIDKSDAHNIIVGSTGSGKTQATILPMLKLALLAEESVVINDPKGEIYKKCSNNFKENNYNIVVLDFEDAKYGDNWNPLKMPYDLYKNNEKDKAVKLIEDLAYYLFYDKADLNLDSFWINSVIDYFTGLCLYIFENGKEAEANLLSILELSKWLDTKENKEILLNKISNNSIIYSYLVGTLKAPSETKGSILSVFNQKIKRYTSREYLMNMLSSKGIDLSNINKDKTIIFIISGGLGYSNNLIPLLIGQIIEQVNINGTNRSLNILLDEFDSMVPIKDFYRIIEYSRSLKVRFSVTIRSYTHLCNMYSKDDAKIIRMGFGNIIYLLSEDIYTLEGISKLCGTVNGNEPLISVEELKTLDIFEAVILKTRMMPIRTKLLPDYKIDWGFTDTDSKLYEKKNTEISIYSE